MNQKLVRYHLFSKALIRRTLSNRTTTSHTPQLLPHQHVKSISSFSPNMSWMDSWSRPRANSKIPAPLYLLHADVRYCQTCGRVLSGNAGNGGTSTKKSGNGKPHEARSGGAKSNESKTNSHEIKYCSDRCRARKPGAKDRAIEARIAALLNDETDSGIEGTAARARIVKGDARMVVTCDEIEAVIFGSRFDPEKVYGRRKNRRSRALNPGKEWRSVDMESSSEDDDETIEMRVPGDAETDADAVQLQPFRVSHVRPAQTDSEINFSAGGGERSKAEKIEESPSDAAKRRDGARRAEEREMVRRAARRLVVFGMDTRKMTTTAIKESNATMPTSKDKSRRARRNTGDSSDDQEKAQDTEVEVKKAEALMNGVVVEPSFAKGNWSIRWRE